MKPRQTARERMNRLRAALRGDEREDRQALADRLEGCAVRWEGRFPCRSPACPRCRWTHIRRQQRITRDWFDHHRNDDLAYVSVVLAATTEVSALADIIAKSKEATRKRLAACRKSSSRWDGVYLRGWHEIDALSSDQVPVLPPDRRAKIEPLVAWSAEPTRPIWIGTYNAVVFLNGFDPQDLRLEFQRQWKLAGQVHVDGFWDHRSVTENLNRIVSYGNKFGCETHLQDNIIQPWSPSWEAEYFSWLQNAQRNPFEALTFSVYPKLTVEEINTSVPSHSLEPMPCSFSTVPMYKYTGGCDGLYY